MSRRRRRQPTPRSVAPRGARPARASQPANFAIDRGDVASAANVNRNPGGPPNFIQTFDPNTGARISTRQPVQDRDPTLSSPISTTGIEWEGTPGSINGGIPPRPAQQGGLRTDVTKQYIADGRMQWYTNWTKTLGRAFDDISVSFGDDIYDRMMKDADVSSSINTFKAGVLEDGLQLSPAVEDKDSPEYELSKQILEAAQMMLLDDNLETPLSTILWNMTDAYVYGNKISEPVWAKGPLAWNKTGYVLQDIRVKPRRSTAFAVDAWLNVVGILGLVPGIGIPVLVSTILTRPDLQPNLIPRNRFFIFTSRSIDSDPRGSSMARAAYTAWNLKMQLWPEFLKWLAQFASPSLIGMLSETSFPDVKRDELGNPVLDPTTGLPVQINPTQALADALAGMKNSSVVALPNGTTVTPLEMKGQGAPFINAFNFLGSQIGTAILHQTLTNQSAKYGTKAQATVHENVLETLIHQGKDALIAAFRRDVLRQWIRWNWGANAAMYCTPKVSLGTTEQVDFASELQAIALAYKDGFIQPSQLPALYRRLQLPPATEDPQPPLPDINTLNQQMGRATGMTVPKPTQAPPARKETAA